MTTMQIHLRTMTISELREFKRQITPNATQMLITALKNKTTSTNPLSRETSPHTDQTFTELPPNRETGPHPNKSMKKLTQALKKRAKHEANQQVRTPNPNQSLETLTKALKRTVEPPHHDLSIKTLADTLRRSIGQKTK